LFHFSQYQAENLYLDINSVFPEYTTPVPFHFLKIRWLEITNIDGPYSLGKATPTALVTKNVESAITFND